MINAKQHLSNSGMTYWYHLRHSMGNAFHLLSLAISSFVHAIFPQIAPEHAARGVISIYRGMRRYSHLRRLQEQSENSTESSIS